MKEYQKQWLKTLQEAWGSPNKKSMVWNTTQSILGDDTGHTDELTQELAKWIEELSR